MNQALLETRGLTKRYGGLLVTDQVDLDIRPGELHAIIGPNGAGKTTLVNQLSGELRADAGTIHFDGRNVSALGVSHRARSGLLRSYQITAVFEEFTVRENVMLAAHGARRHGFSFFRSLLGQRDLATISDAVMMEVGLAPIGNTPAGELAYGQRRQLELAMALAAEPRFLLLDEPMAGMSGQESAAVVALLQRLKGRYGILLVEHDMEAVFALADRITVLVYGKVMFCGTPDEIRNHPEVKAIYLGEEE
ncbi:ABC transporter ATP-binding protein [Herbaspirillum chlorophenolicum]|uniref:ABC transporter ATP-binding protein n=1 Tax=Herbaspirillum chlorophenolicum TaxID=211589 RepID=A0ABW8EX46_9BURK|nr:ABC transporter ATP-binding protein [Herbaspirillum chlorophenolicum]